MQARFRFACIYWGVNSPAVDGLDVPPTSSHPFDVDSNSLAIARTTAQVLNVVYHGGNSQAASLPSGMNGNIKCQSNVSLPNFCRRESFSLSRPFCYFFVVGKEKRIMLEGLFQPMHLLVILFIALMVFGPKKLPELGKGLGDGIRSFKDSMKDGKPETDGKSVEQHEAEALSIKS